VCRHIRNIDCKHHIPILGLTTHDREFEPACRAAGADEFLTKPISHDQFQKLLATWIPSYVAETVR